MADALFAIKNLYVQFKTMSGLVDAVKGASIDVNRGETIAVAESFAIEVGDSICVNGICLTVVKVNDNEFKVSLSAETMTRTTARDWVVGTPDDVAGAVYLLCLPEAAMITGHTLVVDGGFCISG